MQGRLGHRDISGAGAVAEGSGGARSGQDAAGRGLAVALGGGCLADVAMLRAEPAVFGPVASDPTVSRLIDTLAASEERALRAIRAARAESADTSGDWTTGKRLMRAGH